MDNNIIFKIKDSVDLFLSNQSYIMVYYMNTRQRKSFRVNAETVHLLEIIDGKATLREIQKIMAKNYNIEPSQVDMIIDLLIKNRIVTEVNGNKDILPQEIISRYSRQINYFSEFLVSEEDALIAQKKLLNSRVLIFGCGAIGGDIALELAMAGIGHISLYDYDIIEESDLARHMYFKEELTGQLKVYALANELKKVNPEIEVEIISQSMKPNSNIESILIGKDFVVNTLDEPYIGYTASKISRICIKNGLPHYIAGGFDAHLASTGELVIPYVTPCVECYAMHFKETLKDWKPSKHPVSKRYAEIGGLASLSLFSASYACIEIIKYLAGLVSMNESYKIRGEFLFHDMSLTYLNVKRDPNCPVCGGNKIL